MAGVGFELNRILTHRSYSSELRAYTYAGLIGSGPWLIAVLSLGLLSTLLTGTGSTADLRLLFVSISFIYSTTLILTGPLQMVLTRFAADQMFVQRTDRIFPAYLSAIAWVAALFGPGGFLLFALFVPAPPLFLFAAGTLTLCVASTWVTGIFLTALKNYRAVLVAFAAGFLVSLGAAYALGHLAGVPGALWGVAIGHAVLLAILFKAVTRELGHPALDASLLRPAFVKYWDLALGGLLYNLAILGDKFLYWWLDPAAEPVAGFLAASPVYDRVVYFSFVTIVPGMAVFLLKLETEFARLNEQFFDHVLRKATLRQILEIKEALILSLRQNLGLVIRVQGIVTGLLILAADSLIPLLGLGAVQAGVLQVSLLGAFVLVLYLALLTILYYLDKRRDALRCGLLFAATNLTVTLLAIPGGDRFYGVGFLAAATLSCIVAALRVNHHLHNLDYDTFAAQPLYG